MEKSWIFSEEKTMHRRQEQLLKILAESDESMTASVLAEKMNVSVRSIRNYVSQLMAEYPDIVASSAKGYCVDQELAKDLLEKKNEDIPQNNKERAVYLATRLLKTGKDLDIYDIYDELFISESTFQLVLNRMRRMFSKYNLELCKEGNRLCIVGGERSKRHMMSDIVYEESQGIDRESLQKIFPDINFSLIETILQNILSKNHYFAQEYAVTEILLETAIAINQVMKGETIDSTVYYEKLSIPGHIYAMAEGLYRELGEHFHLLFEETEILDMASVLYAQTSSIIPQEKKIDIFHDLAGSETIEIMEIMLQRLKEDFGIILDDKEAELRFSLHMKKLILRARTRHFSHNPLKEYIKKDCPLVYDIAVNLCSVLVEKMALYVNDDEISYVAFYLGNALEESRDYQSRIKIVLNCPSYLSNAQILQKRIESMLKKRVYLMGIVSSEEYLEEYVEADLILTTCQLSNGIQKPNLIITPFFPIRICSG
ncbi:PRD domain-containing protein [bacterium 1XD8-76]|nr:PRD domain-containing protein [bacterium 1XD8-76]